MSKLYPPQIEETIAAFYVVDGKASLSIPFVMNQAVSKSEVKEIAVKIKSILNNEVLFTGTTDVIDYDKNIITIELANYNDYLKIGQYYKAQIAYINLNNEVGYYSTVGITKFTTKPTVKLVGDLTPGKLHCVNYSYTGEYSQVGLDSTEKVYSYEFAVYDKNNNLYLTSGELLHNHENDTEGNLSTDTWELTKALPEDEVFTLYYKVTTSNGLEESSAGYRIYTGETVDPEVEIDVTAEMDNDNGICTIALKPTGSASTLNGSFILSRASNKDNYTSWEQLQKFKYAGKPINTFEFVDYTIEHGFTYKYSLQQVNSNTGLISNRIISNAIEANFDDMFLFDGERQLKIKFNPKVSSFKQTVLEQKQNSIGGKYPYFFRNAQVNYKEFPISGLISYQEDENQFFLTNEEMLLDDYSSLERENTLDPNVSGDNDEYFMAMDDLGQAYQLQEIYRARDKKTSGYSRIKNQRARTTNLEHYNFMAERIFKLKVLEFLNNGKTKLFRSPAEGNYIIQLMSTSMTPNDQLGRMLHTFSSTASEVADYDIINLKKYSFLPKEEEKYKINNIQLGTIKMPTVEDQLSLGGIWSKNLLPQASTKIQCQDMFLGDKILINDKTEIEIGPTGTFELEVDETISSVKVLYPISPSATIIYSYWGEAPDQFGRYESVEIEEVPCEQYINTNEEEPLNINRQFKLYHSKWDTIEEILKFYRITFYKNLSSIAADEQTKLKAGQYYVVLDGQNIDITYKDELYIKDASFIDSITIGPNVVANVTYQKKIIKLAEGESANETKLSS